MADLLPVGKVSKLFGRKGEVMISLYDTFPDNFNREEPLMVEIDSLTVPLFLSGFERRGVSGALASFEDLDTAERAAELVGKELCIECDSEVEPEDDEFYMEDLIGFTVEAGTVQEGKMLHGRLTDYYDSEANPLFEIEFDGRSVLVPAVEEFIAHIDFEGRMIKMVLPEGLLELE